MGKVLQSVGGVLARPGEGVEDVIHRIKWGEGGPGLAELLHLNRELADPEFADIWNAGSDPKRIGKYVEAYSVLAHSVSFAVVEGKINTAIRKAVLLSNILPVRFTQGWHNGIGYWDLLLFPSNGRMKPLGLRVHCS